MPYKQQPSPLAQRMLGDLNKDGKMSSYETKRQNAIEKSMEENSVAKQRLPKEPMGPHEHRPTEAGNNYASFHFGGRSRSGRNTADTRDPRVVSHNEKLGSKTAASKPMKINFEVKADPFNKHSKPGNMVYSMQPVVKGKMKAPNTASRRDNT